MGLNIDSLKALLHMANISGSHQIVGLLLIPEGLDFSYYYLQFLDEILALFVYLGICRIREYEKMYKI